MLAEERGEAIIGIGKIFIVHTSVKCTGIREMAHKYLLIQEVHNKAWLKISIIQTPCSVPVSVKGFQVSEFVQINLLYNDQLI